MATAEALPAGWTAQTTAEGHVYYINSDTGVSQWERPAPDAAPEASVGSPSAEAAVYFPCDDGAGNTYFKSTRASGESVWVLPDGAWSVDVEATGAWVEMVADSGHPYWLHRHDGSSTWERPAAFTGNVYTATSGTAATAPEATAVAAPTIPVPPVSPTAARPASPTHSVVSTSAATTVGSVTTASTSSTVGAHAPSGASTVSSASTPLADKADPFPGGASVGAGSACDEFDEDDDDDDTNPVTPTAAGWVAVTMRRGTRGLLAFPTDVGLGCRLDAVEGASTAGAEDSAAPLPGAKAVGRGLPLGLELYMVDDTRVARKDYADALALFSATAARREVQLVLCPAGTTAALSKRQITEAKLGPQITEALVECGIRDTGAPPPRTKLQRRVRRGSVGATSSGGGSSKRGGDAHGGRAEAPIQCQTGDEVLRWAAMTDAAGRTYYCHMDTGRLTWYKPRVKPPPPPAPGAGLSVGKGSAGAAVAPPPPPPPPGGPAAGGAGGGAAKAGEVAPPPLPDMPDWCKARVWGGGQCPMFVDDDRTQRYCKGHRRKQPHGDIEGAWIGPSAPSATGTAQSST